jgi:NitT/TauT family transport system substrate-binding protein
MNPKIIRSLRALGAAVGLCVLMAACLNVGGEDSSPTGGSGAQAATKLGTPGEPIDLVIGYQPYYSQAWSGVAMRAEKFWEKYLPEGSNVTFQVGLQGSVIVSQMLGGKQQIGYVGDMPALVATSKRNTLPIDIVASLGSAWDQCNIFLTTPDAPNTEAPTQAVKSLDGKTVATPQGSCTDRFTQAVFDDQGVEPSAYLNQSIEVIASNFQTNRIDAATVWEPVASHLVNEGIAKRVASGANYNERDAGFLIMSEELINKRPDVVKAYLKAELDAQQWMADPKNAMALARHAAEQSEGYSVKDMWDGMFKSWPDAEGQSAERIKNLMPFVVDDQLEKHIDKSWAFLHKIKAIPQADPPDGIVRDEIARKVLEESGADFPVKVKSLPESKFDGQ